MQRGGMKNFTTTFPVIDLNFGTYYMPKGALPDAYGIGEPEFPRSFGRQLLYPFVAPKGAAGGENDGGGSVGEMPPVAGSGRR